MLITCMHLQSARWPVIKQLDAECEATHDRQPLLHAYAAQNKGNNRLLATRLEYRADCLGLFLADIDACATRD